MKLNYSLRFLVILIVVGGSAFIWANDGVDRGLDLKGGASLVYRLDLESIPESIRSETLQSTVMVIEDRINNLGLRDLRVDALPPDRFEVQFPGKESSDIDRIKGILTRLGKLEFRIVALPPKATMGSPGFETEERKRMTEMGSAYPGAPPGYRWVPQRASRDSNGREIPPGEPRLVEIPEGRIDVDIARLEQRKQEPDVAGDPARVAEVDRQIQRKQEERKSLLRQNYFTGSDLNPGDLRIRPGDFGAGYVVTFATTADREANFGDFTERNQLRQMAIIIDGEMESAPVIQEKLPGRGQISGGGMGGFTKEQAQDLVTVLRSGSLAVKITLQSEFALGPSLGEAAIWRGMIASALGVGAVVIIMVYAYLFAGIIAVLALAMNLLMIMGVLAFGQAELSMPGIAGLLLTVGMAVDANILIFERIREERASGKSIVQAVKAGYDRAFITIVDSNVTTVFTGVVLYFITTGVVRGFAVTLIWGIAASMFTAIYGTKTIFGWLIDKGWLTDMRFTRIFFTPKLSYMKLRLPMIVLSLVIIILGMVAYNGAGRSKYDIEFLGGQRVVTQFREPVPIAEVQEKVVAGFADASIISIKSTISAAQKSLDLKTSSDAYQITIAGADTEEKRAEVLAYLQKTFGDRLVPHGLVSLSPEEVLPGAAREYALNFDADVSREQIEKALAAVAEKPALKDLAGRQATISVQTADPEVFLENLDRALGEAEIGTSEPFPMKSFVDPQTAQKHRDDAVAAVIISLVFQILYIYFRFHGASYGFAATLALVHDTLVTLGAIAFFGMTGLVNVKINLTIIAAILTLIGYSMNDTIVIFDRIRENLGKGKANLSEIIDLSVNQTLARTIRTALTVFVVVLFMFVINYGAAASVLEGFGFVLIIGVIAGSYSTVFIAAPLLLFLPWHYFRAKGPKFWSLVAASCVGAIALLFATGGLSTWIPLILLCVYPAYFMFDFIRWLFVKDADRALNLILRGSSVKA